MSDTLETALRWTGRALVPAAGVDAAAPALREERRSRTGAGAPPARPGLLVADSWLVDEGRARRADLHWARFAGSCAEAGVGREELVRFEAAVQVALPAAGRWFPRVELTAGGLALRLRAAPALALEARVVAGPPGDPRALPRRKGPDLELLARLRAGARERGADELLLRDEGGALREGALSSLLWWEGATLCSAPDAVVLPGITRALLLAIARERGVEVRLRSPRPGELAGREAWLTSALHGIRVVGAWLHPVQEAGAGERAPAWRELLDGA